MHISLLSRKLITISLGVALSTLVVCALVRLLLIYRMAESDKGAPWYALFKLGALYASNDVLATSILIGVILTLIVSIQKAPFQRAVVALGTVALVSISLLSLVSFETIPLYRWPLTLDLIVYSRFFSDPVAREYVYSFIQGDFVVLIGAALLFSLAMPLLLLRLCQLLFVSDRLIITAALGFVPILVIYLILSQRALSGRTDEHMYINAATALALSAATSPLQKLMQYKSRTSPLDTAEGAPAAPDFRLEPTNVIVFVMESVGARYIDAHGGSYGVTPNLDRLLASSIFFERAYAQAPSSTIALHAMLGSSIPLSPYQVERDTTSQASLISELTKRGVRTAFFTSGTPYQSELDFILRQGFDVIRNAEQIGCDDAPMISIEDNTSGQSDRCTVDALLEWIDNRPGQPFFAVQWTYQTHYPYFTRAPRHEISVPAKLDSWTKETLSRYLNALRESDADLGYLVEELRSRKLEKATLLVVIGDHGEAFGQHGFGGHGSDVYEESVQIPLIFINPEIGQRRTYRDLFAQVDLAPTLADLLGIAKLPSWKGKSIFASGREQIVFMAQARDTRIGLRQGSLKYILTYPPISMRDLFLDNSEGVFEKYDLSSDPDEQRNLGVANLDEQDRVKSEMSQWLRSLTR